MRFYRAILNGEANAWASEFSHGYTFSAHPVACAAALATLDIYESEGLFERAAALSTPLLNAIGDLADMPIVKDVARLRPSGCGRVAYVGEARRYGVRGAEGEFPSGSPAARFWRQHNRGAVIHLCRQATSRK